MGIVQIPPPGFQISTQPFEIKLGEGTVRPIEIPYGTLQNRAGADMIASGLVMKSDRQLNHTLEMPAHRPVAGQRAPNVLENFMSVEKAATVEEVETCVEVPVMRRQGHTVLAGLYYSTFVDNLHVSIDKSTVPLQKNVELGNQKYMLLINRDLFDSILECRLHFNSS